MAVRLRRHAAFCHAQPAAAAIGDFMAVVVTAAFVACPLYTYYAVHHGPPSQ